MPGGGWRSRPARNRPRPWKRAAGGDGRGASAAPPFVETGRRSAAGLGETVPMENWKLERIGAGRYHIRGADGWRLAGLILGGRRRWLVELAGRTWPGAFPSARAAAAALAEYHAIRSAIADVRAAV